MKFFLKVIFMSALSGGLILALEKFGLLRLHDFVQALSAHKKHLVFATLFQLIIFACMLGRYKSLLDTLGIKTPLNRVSAATFIGLAAGSTLSGSMAVIEMVRVGLMLGSDPQEHMLSKMMVASLLDRLLGFFVILALGACMGIYTLYFFQGQVLEERNLFLLRALVLGSVLGTICVALLPWVSQKKLLTRLLERFLLKGRPGFYHNIAMKAKNLVLSLELAFQTGTQQKSRLIVPTFYSVGAAVCSGIAFYYSYLAVGFPVNLSAIFITFPVIAVAQVLPIGIAGVGGQQLVAIAIFSIFSLQQDKIAQASLLWNVLQVVISIILAMWFGAAFFQKVKKIIFSKRASTLA